MTVANTFRMTDSYFYLEKLAHSRSHGKLMLRQLCTFYAACISGVSPFYLRTHMPKLSLTFISHHTLNGKLIQIF